MAYKSEQAVDIESGAIVAVTAHGGAAADTETIQQTVCEAGTAVAELIAEPTPDGEYKVHPEASQRWWPTGYHSNEVVRDLSAMEVRSYLVEPERGPRNWEVRETEHTAVYASRRWIRNRLLAEEALVPGLLHGDDLSVDRKQDGELTFLTMELLRGEMLAERLRRTGKVTI